MSTKKATPSQLYKDHLELFKDLKGRSPVSFTAFVKRLKSGWTVKKAVNTPRNDKYATKKLQSPTPVTLPTRKKTASTKKVSDPVKTIGKVQEKLKKKTIPVRISPNIVVNMPSDTTHTEKREPNRVEKVIGCAAIIWLMMALYVVFWVVIDVVIALIYW